MAERGVPADSLTDRMGLTLLAVLSAALAALMVLPYLQYVLFGVVLAYLFVPIQRRIEEYLSPGLAALTLVVVAILAILLPALYLLAIAFQEALQLVAAVQSGSLELSLIERQLEEIGYSVDLHDLYDTYEDSIVNAARSLALGALATIGGLPNMLIGLTVTVFVLFALLRDREQFLTWIQRVLPVREELQDEMFAQLDQLMWASVVGNVAVAAIQSVVLGLGLALLGVPAVAFLTVTTFVFTLLPLIGAFGVWVPVSAYLLAMGRPIAAVVLVLFGSVVSASDMYLRPALIGRTSAFNAAIIVVGIFGGLVVFGAVGLFIGPVVLGGSKITLDVFARERDARLADEPDATPKADDGSSTPTPSTAAVGAEPDGANPVDDASGLDGADPST